MINLLNCTRSQINDFLDSFDYIFTDYDGVLCYANRTIDGSQNALIQLKKINKEIYVVSNNTLNTVDDYYKRIQRFGFSDIISKDRIFFPTLVIIDYLQNINFDKNIFLIGPKAMKCELEKSGFHQLQFPYETIMELMNKLIDDISIGAVIIDFDINISYISLMKAVLYLKRKDVIFLSGSSESSIPFKEDCKLIGPYHFQAIMEHFTNRTAIKCSKPYKQMEMFIKKHILYSDNKRVLFIGDSIRQDIEFAKMCQFQSLLVQSGENKIEDCINKIQPDYYLNSLDDFNILFKKL